MPLQRNQGRGVRPGNACDSWHSPLQNFLVDFLSTSSIGGPSGVVPALASAPESGSGVRLVEAWLAGSLDTVRRVLFLPRDKGHCYISKYDNHGAGFKSYICDGVSVLTAFPLSLPGFGAPCWRVTAGSARRPDGLPCKTQYMCDR